MSEVFKKDIVRQAVRFGIVGVECTVLNYLVFLILLIYLQINYLISASLGFIAGVFLGFLFNKFYTFKSDKTIAFSLPRYFLVYILSLIANLILLNLLVTNTNLGAVYSNILLAPLIILLNFLGAKIIAFENKKW